MSNVMFKRSTLPCDIPKNYTDLDYLGAEQLVLYLYVHVYVVVTIIKACYVLRQNVSLICKCKDGFILQLIYLARL